VLYPAQRPLSLCLSLSLSLPKPQASEAKAWAKAEAEEMRKGGLEPQWSFELLLGDGLSSALDSS